MYNQEVEECILAIKNGDRDAFEFVVETYQTKIYKYIRYIVHNQWDTDDILQDVFIKIYTNLKQYKENTNFEGWIYRMAYNHTMTILKKKAKEPIVCTDHFPEVTHMDTHRSEFSDEIKYTLKKLTPEERTLIFLRVNEGLNYNEIAVIMKKRDSLLRKRFERAKNKFIKYYEEVSQDENRRIQQSN